MTTELKTLTDLREKFTSEEWTKHRMGIIKHEEILREAAINWIKKLENKDDHFVALLSGVTEHDMETMSGVFKHFFNINDDALRGNSE